VIPVIQESQVTLAFLDTQESVATAEFQATLVLMAQTVTLEFQDTLVFILKMLLAILCI